MAKKMIIKGVGTFMAKRVSADGKGTEVITLGTLQSLKIDFNVEIEDIFGGDGLFAIDTLVRNKSIEISATDAKFDLDAVKLMMGSVVEENQDDVPLWVMGEQDAVIPGTDPAVDPGYVVVEYGTNLHGGGNFAVRVKDSNKLLTQDGGTGTTAPTTVDSGKYKVALLNGGTPTAELRIYFNKDLNNADVVYNYQRLADGVDVVNLLRDEVPFPVHVVHHGSFLQKDGSFAGVETELYSCIPQGQFSIDAQRVSASASSIALRVIDPERADGKLGSIKRYSSNKKV